MKPLRATIGTSQPVMSAQDFDTLFFRVPELHELHSNFYQELKPRLDDWNADTAVGIMFKRLVSTKPQKPEIRFRISKLIGYNRSITIKTQPHSHV